MTTQSHPFVLIGIPGHKRTLATAAAARDKALPLVVVPWLDVLAAVGDVTQGAGNPPWARDIPPGAIVKLDSPGQCFETERMLLRLGEEDAFDNDTHGALPPVYRCISRREIDAMQPDRGAIAPMWQWFLGWILALRHVRDVLKPRGVHWVNPPEDLLTMFDKQLCQMTLETAGVPTPPSHCLLGDGQALLSRMREKQLRAVFIKPCAGSSASGVIALRMGPAAAGYPLVAVSSLEMVRGEGSAGEVVRWYNSRKVRRYAGQAEVLPLLEFARAERSLVEEWMPKDSFAGQTYDLRIVVIAGRATHVAVRLSRHPITNLHLGGTRGDVAALRAHIGEAAWTRALETAEAVVARAFPRCQCVGIDLMLSARTRRPYVLEVNAFGDFLPGLPGLYSSRDTYAEQLAALPTSRLH
ncbi:hypothetical protein DB346_02565 [Verrucomicrobia bacterium LW23]|nr:hypothetical protein DB346_04090 [Verrucomicrobia bacterium LW23]PTY04331.1 hypothetical protein DB346_02565 [Verrucomicrobia bacterium LW23]